MPGRAPSVSQKVLTLNKLRQPHSRADWPLSPSLRTQQFLGSTSQAAALNTLRASFGYHSSAPEKHGQAPSLAQGKQQARVGRPLPGLVQAAGEPLGLHLVPMDEDPHPGINIEHCSIGAE